MYSNGSSDTSLIDDVRTLSVLVAELLGRVKAKPPAVGIDPDASVNRIAKALKRGMNQRRFRWLITTMSELDRVDRQAARKAANGNGHTKPRIRIIDHLADQIPLGNAD
jgi:hypothetical protein